MLHMKSYCPCDYLFITCRYQYLGRVFWISEPWTLCERVPGLAENRTWTILSSEGIRRWRGSAQASRSERLLKSGLCGEYILFSKAVFRMDIGSYIGIIVGPLAKLRKGFMYFLVRACIP